MTSGLLILKTIWERPAIIRQNEVRICFKDEHFVPLFKTIEGRHAIIRQGVVRFFFKDKMTKWLVHF
jgi:hypothetical protein